MTIMQRLEMLCSEAVNHADLTKGLIEHFGAPLGCLLAGVAYVVEQEAIAAGVEPDFTAEEMQRCLYGGLIEAYDGLEELQDDIYSYCTIDLEYRY